MVDLSIVMLNYQRVLTIPHRNSPFGVEKNDRWRLEFGLSVVGSMTPVASSLVAPSWWCVVKISTPWLENASQYHTIYWYIYIYYIYILYIYIYILYIYWIYWMYWIYWAILVKPNYIPIHQCTVSAKLPELFIPLGRWPQNSWEFFILSWFSCSAQTFRSGRSG